MITTQTMNKPAKIVGSGIQGYNSSADGLPALCVSHCTQALHSMQKKWISAKRMTSRSPQRGSNHHRRRQRGSFPFLNVMKTRKQTTRAQTSPEPYEPEVQGISDCGKVNGRRKYA